MSRNITFLWDNTSFDAATLTATSEVSTLPVGNVQDTIRKKVWRTTGDADLCADFGAEAYVSSVGLVEHTLAPDATFTVEAWENSTAGNERAVSGAAANEGSGLVSIPCAGHGLAEGDFVFISGSTYYDGIHELPAQTLGDADTFIITATYTAETISDTTAANVVLGHSEEFESYDPLLGWGEGGWGELGWGGAADEDYLESLPKIARIVFLSTTVGARYWRIRFDNAGSAFDLGRAFLCREWAPEKQVGYGWRLTRVDPSNVDLSMAGVMWSDLKDQYFEVLFGLGRLSEGEALGELVRLANHVGTRRDGIMQLSDASSKLKNYTTIYGRFAKDLGITAAGPGRYEAQAITFREAL